MMALVGPLGPRRELIGGMRRSNRVLSFVAGLILVLARFYDTVVYWLI
jgi:hypothetical protein